MREVLKSVSMSFKEERGITLIALVITVIVLLIFAGVSISLVVGNNGVLTQASNAVIESRKAEAREDVVMAFASAEADYWSEWTKNSSLVKDENYYNSKIPEYLSKTGTFVSLVYMEQDGTYEVKYNKFGNDYTFIVDQNGNVSFEGAVASTGGSNTETGTQEPQFTQYSVRFNSNGGTIGSMDDQNFSVNTAQKLRKNNFERDGYKFIGWSRDSSSTTATYKDEQNVLNLSTTNEDIINLYAVWQIVGGGTATGGNKTYSDGTNNTPNTAIIPEGWTVSGFSDEQTIASGLVIYDLGGATVSWTAANKSSIQSSYNQFVWVPVPDYSKFTRNYWQDWSGTSEPTQLTTEDFTEAQLSESEKVDPTGKYGNMCSSVETNHGFYIARYEAGTTNTDTTKTSGIRGDVVSRKNAEVYNNIGWNGTSSSDSKETQKTTATGGAVAVSRGMYTQGVTSTLCYGVQWDAVMRWISQDNNLKVYITNSSGKGNYKGHFLFRVGK